MIRHDPVHELAELLRDYLAANPNACDTERGIADRWLAEAPLPPAPTVSARRLAYSSPRGFWNASRATTGASSTFVCFCAGTDRSVVMPAAMPWSRASAVLLSRTVLG